jgi:hypothetical protein
MSQAHAYRFGFLSARQIRLKSYIRRFRRCDCRRPNNDLGAGVRMGEELKFEVNEHRKRLLRVKSVSLALRCKLPVYLSELLGNTRTAIRGSPATRKVTSLNSTRTANRIDRFALWTVAD